MIKWEPGERIVVTSTPVATGIPETIELEVIRRGRVKVLRCEMPHLMHDLIVGAEYELKPHEPQTWLELWEFPDESCICLWDWNDRPGATPGIERDL